MHQWQRGSLPSDPPAVIADGAVEAVTSRIAALVQRIDDVERALGVQEWWLLADAIAEARVLSELVSLLAVARGEMTHLLRERGGLAQWPPQGEDLADDDYAAPPPDVSNPVFLQASRDQALGLMRLAALAIPAIHQYTRALLGMTRRAPVPVSLVDALEAAEERLADATDLIAAP